MLKDLAALTVAAGILAASGAASAERGVEIRVREAPPPVRVEHVRPRPGYFWVEGYYVRRHNHWAWQSGHWERNRRGYDYVPGRWEERGGYHVWVGPAWRHH